MSTWWFFSTEYMCATALIIIGIVSGTWDSGDILFAIMILWSVTMILFCNRKDFDD